MAIKNSLDKWKIGTLISDYKILDCSTFKAFRGKNWLEMKYVPIHEMKKIASYVLHT